MIGRKILEKIDFQFDFHYSADLKPAIFQARNTVFHLVNIF